MTIKCDTNNVCFQLGQTNGADVFESGSFHDLYFTNVDSGHGASAVALQINGANANVWSNIQAGVVPATAGSAGFGVAVQMTMAAFNTFSATSVGNANIGIQFTDLGKRRASP